MTLLRSHCLKDEEIEEFRQLVRETTGQDFSSDDAATLADMLINVLTVVQDVIVDKELGDS